MGFVLCLCLCLCPWDTHDCSCLCPWPWAWAPHNGLHLRAVMEKNCAPPLRVGTRRFFVEEEDTLSRWTRRQDFLSQQEDMSSCWTGRPLFAFNKKTCRLVRKEEGSSCWAKSFNNLMPRPRLSPTSSKPTRKPRQTSTYFEVL